MPRPRKGVRKWLYRKFNGVCMWCKGAITYDQCSIEHIIPRARGGTDDIENLGLSCRDCNNIRGDNIMPPKRRTA